MTKTERWLPVVGFESYYEVSCRGRIRRSAPAQNTYPGRVLNPSTDIYGYLVVHLVGGGGSRYLKVHRIVMAAFAEPCPERHTVNHKNGKKTDNRWPENLEYLTAEDNWNHAYKNGGMPHGEKHGMAKITADDVIAIRSSPERNSVLAKRYGVNRQSISMIKLRQTWKHVISQ